MNNLQTKQRCTLLIDAIDNICTSNKNEKQLYCKNECKTKEDIDDFIENVNNYYIKKSYNSAGFSGWTVFDIIKSKLESKNPDFFDDADRKNLPLPLPFLRNINKRCCKVDKPEKNLTKISVNVEIENLGSLIKLINDYPIDDMVEYNINMKLLHKIKDPLIELNSMIGMTSLKENIVDQILYYIQDLHIVNNATSCDFMHTVIYGPPGSGKTEIAKIIGKIFSNMGILKKGTFKKVCRSDLISGYLGQTAIKTRDVINESIGGCLFIDEAYSLGNSEKRDSFSKECIDTLCEALSDHKNELMVIIAGYEKELNDCFFAYNQGLDSRFTWRFKTDHYKATDLYNIFLKKVNDCNWKVDAFDKISDKAHTISWFDKNIDYFKFFGRDIETLLAKIKIAHSRRIFCKNVEEKTILKFDDLERGFVLYLKNDEVKNRKEDIYKNGYLQRTMYL